MIELSHVSKRFGEDTAVDDISLHVAKGKFCALVGSSGCGKSTTLRMINRLIAHSSGDIILDGQLVEQYNPVKLRRRIGYVIQSTGLFPHWTVARNIGLVPRLLKWSSNDVTTRVNELMHLLGLPVEEFAHKYPHQLSGGQAQRVGVARALAADPDILLMDEPFGALDPITREKLQDELAKLQARLHKTVVFVTHDMDEALKLADHLVVMREGRIVQQGTPLALLQHPNDPFVESLLGGLERGLKQAALTRVKDHMTSLGQSLPAQARIPADFSLRQALSMMLRDHCDRLTVVDQQDMPIGELSLRKIVKEARVDKVSHRDA
ncbi:MULTISPECIES: ABC transporter ATP-binding protein [Vreelandella]|jgi:osmoprotectant transport system ATP-binding protein|uniref:Quaternary amine transport ATP-binding protein n=2 Tax=Vreelandella TaxID=3137766 RepID=A0A7C9JUK1_9GAMM|nr:MULTISPECIES: ABC transporter ATP-binding protein [Halomonas]NDL69298.1 ABC transporter ATP-binding protein [Halomonas alkaliphila]NYS43971.1 ABC transporter ATP-binding protein [Halomonas zhaodongensis]